MPSRRSRNTCATSRPSRSRYRCWPDRARSPRPYCSPARRAHAPLNSRPDRRNRGGRHPLPRGFLLADRIERPSAPRAIRAVAAAWRHPRRARRAIRDRRRARGVCGLEIFESFRGHAKRGARNPAVARRPALGALWISGPGPAGRPGMTSSSYGHLPDSVFDETTVICEPGQTPAVPVTRPFTRTLVRGGIVELCST